MFLLKKKTLDIIAWLKNLILEKRPDLYFNLFARSQNENFENISLVKFATLLQVDNSFIEFGFSPFEFNSIGLAKKNFNGLLIDSNPTNCVQFDSMNNSLKLRVKAKNYCLALGKLEPILDFVKTNGNRLGVLSVDIDGNDFWVLKEILNFVEPDLICVEFNSTFGLRSIACPYDPDFDRMTKHRSGFYHGASLIAFHKLLEKSYVFLQNVHGVNLIFARKEICTKNGMVFHVETDPKNMFIESVPRASISGLKLDEQWDLIKDLDYIHI